MEISSHAKSRFLSLDVLRGISIAGMILVNNQGDWSCVYPALAHASWNGILGADFVFPFFLFVMGASLYFSLSARIEAGTPRGLLVMWALRRSAILVSLGLFLNLFPLFDFGTVRIPGVLQRIGLCYCFAALLFIYTGRRAQVIIVIIITVLYAALILFVTPHGFGPGSLEPCCNLPGYIDGLLFPGHTYEHAPYPGFDPEGLLSTLPAIVSTMLGVFSAARIGSASRRLRARLVLPCSGLLLAAAGLALSPLMPINKSLWTPTYLMFTGGAAIVVFFFCHLAYDSGGTPRSAVPFLVLGRNAIAVYLLSSIAGKAMITIHISGDGTMTSVKSLLYSSLFQPLARPCTASFLYAAAFLAVWTVIMYFPYRKGRFLSV